MRENTSGRRLLVGLVLLAVLAMFLVPGTADAKKPAPPPPDDPPPATDPDPAIAFWQFDSRAGISVLNVMDPDGSNRREVVDAPGLQARRPTWSPDNTRVAFTCVRSGGLTTLVHMLYVVNLDGTGLELLLDDTAFTGEGVAIGEPDWSPMLSPDGEQKIAFLFGDLDSSDVYLMNPDGTGLQNLTRGERGDFLSHPHWSPDGKRLAVERLVPGESFDLVVFDLGRIDGELAITGESTALRLPWDANIISMDWARTSDRILISAYTADGRADLSYVDLDDPGVSVPVTQTSDADEYWGVWSADDTRIVFQLRGRDKKLNGICSMKPDGTDLRFLAEGSYPAWRR